MSQQNVINRLKSILTAEQDRGNVPISPSILLDLIQLVEGRERLSEIIAAKGDK